MFVGGLILPVYCSVFWFGIMRFGEDAPDFRKTIQIYKEELFMDIFLSALPILVVLVGIIGLNKPAKIVAPIAFAVTFVIGMFYFGEGLDILWTNAWTGIVSGTKVVYMIMAAFCILNMLIETGAMDKIRELIIAITDDKRKHVIIVAFGFGAFLEGCAGAGTPAAVAAPALVGLGISPVFAVLSSLIANGIWSSWGAAGLTCSGGFAAMVAEGRGAVYNWPALDSMTVSEIYNMLSRATARVNAVGAFLCPWVITAVCYGKKGFKGLVPFLFINSVVGAAAMIAVTHTIGFEFTSIISGLIIVAVDFIYLKAANLKTPEEFVAAPPADKSPIPAWKAVFTYALLLVALPCARFGLEGSWLYGRGFAVWIGTTIIVVCFIGSIVLGYTKSFHKCVAISFKSVIGALIAMAFLSGLAEAMKSAGMLSILAKALAAVVGKGYPAAAVFIGCIGSFMTGTTLGSNIMFHPMHIEAAQILGISPAYTAAVNSSGGALGNMICPNNVIAVCATVNFQNQEGIIMRKVVPALVVLMIAEMIAALLYVLVIFPGYYM
mgnify:FL=1